MQGTPEVSDGLFPALVKWRFNWYKLDWAGSRSQQGVPLDLQPSAPLIEQGVSSLSGDGSG